MIDSDERLRRRDQAIVRWLRINAEGLTHLECAQGVVESPATRCRESSEAADRALARAQHSMDRRLRELDHRHEVDAVMAGLPKVLLADDRSTERVLLMRALRNDGRLHLVGDAVDGAELVGLVIVEQPDVVVLDRELPTLSTLTVAAEVRRYARHTRCVLLDDGCRDSMADVDAVYGRTADRRALVELVVRLSG